MIFKKKKEPPLSFEEAKRLFFRYRGSTFGLDFDGYGDAYRKCRIPRETEEEWRREIKEDLLHEISGEQGKKRLSAVQGYAEMISDDEAASFLCRILRDCDLDSFSATVICEQLQEVAQKVHAERDYYLRVVRENAERLLASPITVDQSFLDDPGMNGYDLSDENLRRRIKELIEKESLKEAPGKSGRRSGSSRLTKKDRIRKNWQFFLFLIPFFLLNLAFLFLLREAESGTASSPSGVSAILLYAFSYFFLILWIRSLLSPGPLAKILYKLGPSISKPSALSTALDVSSGPATKEEIWETFRRGAEYFLYLSLACLAGGVSILVFR